MFIRIFGLNVLLFYLFSQSRSCGTYFIQRFRSSCHDILHTLYSLRTFPISLATIVNMIAFVCIPAWRPWTQYTPRSHGPLCVYVSQFRAGSERYGSTSTCVRFERRQYIAWGRSWLRSESLVADLVAEYIVFPQLSQHGLGP